MPEPSELETTIAAYAARFTAEAGIPPSALDCVQPLDRAIASAADSAALALIGARTHAAPAGIWLTGVANAIDAGTVDSALLLPPQLAADLAGLHRTAADYTAAREQLIELARIRAFARF